MAVIFPGGDAVVLAGVVLLSQDLALTPFPTGRGPTLPSLAAVAWAHDQIRPKPADLAGWLGAVERFALDDYAPALLAGHDLPPDRRRAIAERLAGFTGLSADTWLAADLRIEASRFRAMLLADQGRIIGREDTRADGFAPPPGEDAVSSDPFGLATRGQKLAAFEAYARDTLGIVGGLPFKPYIDGPDIHASRDRPGGVAGHLRQRRRRPRHRDEGEPAAPRADDGRLFRPRDTLFRRAYMLSLLAVPDRLRANLAWHAYAGGHSTYLDDDVRRDMHERIARWIALPRTGD